MNIESFCRSLCDAIGSLTDKNVSWDSISTKLANGDLQIDSLILKYCNKLLLKLFAHCDDYGIVDLSKLKEEVAS